MTVPRMIEARVARPMATSASLAAVLLSLAVALALSLCGFHLATLQVKCAWADEPDTSAVETPDGGNTVNLNQLPDSSFLYDTDIATLTDADSYHDTQTVQVRGQAVGDLIADESDPTKCWVTLQELEDRPNAVVSVIMTREQATIIDQLGRYGMMGTTLQVKGTFHLDCVDHQGLTDIHADEVLALEKGYPMPKDVHPVLLSLLGLCAALALALYLAYRYRLDRSK